MDIKYHFLMLLVTLFHMQYYNQTVQIYLIHLIFAGVAVIPSMNLGLK